MGSGKTRILVSAALVALLIEPAYAQKPSLNLMHERPKDPVAEERRRTIDLEYKSATEKIPDQKKKNNDPWQNMRSAAPTKK